ALSGRFSQGFLLCGKRNKPPLSNPKVAIKLHFCCVKVTETRLKQIFPSMFVASHRVFCWNTPQLPLAEFYRRWGPGPCCRATQIYGDLEHEKESACCRSDHWLCRCCPGRNFGHAVRYR